MQHTNCKENIYLQLLTKKEKEKKITLTNRDSQPKQPWKDMLAKKSCMYLYYLKLVFSSVVDIFKMHPFFSFSLS